MTTEIEETSTPKVVNWDVAEERDFEKLKVEMDEHKDKMMALEKKASLLQGKLDKKVELAEANAYSGVKVFALEYKTVKLPVKKMFVEKTASLKPKPNCFGFGRLPPPPPEMLDVLNNIYKEYEEETIKKLGQEGWTLRAILPAGDGQVLYYFSRPL